MRIEKRFAAMGHELGGDVTPVEAGMEFALARHGDWLGRSAVVESECRRLEQLVPADGGFDPDGFVRVKGVRTLDKQGHQNLRELFALSSDEFPRSLTASEQGMRLDALFTLSDDYLQKVDVASMAFSLESREPLLDQELIEWGMRLPLKWKLHGGQNKYLLRQLAYRYIPQKILDRPKQGFEVPIDRWLRGPLKDWALERVESRELYQDGPLDQSQVRKLFELHISGRRNVHPLLWASLMYLDFAATQSSFVRQHQAAWRQSSG